MPMVDERIVNMQFNNQEFERNAQQSIGTLDKLKQALHLDGAAAGLSKIQEAANNLTFSIMGDSIGIVTDKFSMLQAVGVRVLNDIVGKVHEATQKFGGLIKSMSVDQIGKGWEKFSDKTTSVATIVSQGYGLEEVNEQLNRLNWFTDETSYNFTDMVGNIGKFTATGQKLDDSVTAMEGIALWAALSGQNAGTASRAMYQLSQAMGAGVLRKEDYKSIQNASMDTDEFRQKALDAAVALGKLKKNSDGTYSSLVSAAKAGQNFTKGKFAESLTEGQWFDTDVMMEVFKNYSGAVEQLYKAVESGEYDTASEAIEGMAGSLDEFQLKAFKAGQEARTWADVVESVKDAVSTGWMNTFEIIFGNYEEAKQLWTDLANALWDVFAGGAEARNEMLAEWKELGGRDALLESFWNTFNSLVTIIETFKGAFHDIFPSIEADKLYDMTVKLQNFTGKINDFFTNVERYGKLKEEGIFSYKDEEDRLKSINDTIEKLTKTRDRLNSIGNGIDSEGNVIHTEEQIENIEKLNKRIKDLTAYRDEFKDGMIDERQYRIIDGVYSSLQGIFALLDIGRMALGAVFDIAKKFITVLFPMTTGIFDAGKSFGEWAVGLRDSLKESQFFETIVNSLAPKIVAFGETIKRVATALKDYFAPVIEFIKPILKDIAGLFTPFLDEIKTFLGLNEKVNKFSEAGVSMADAMGTVEEKLGPIGTVLRTVGDAFQWFFGLFHKTDETGEKVSVLASALDFLKKVIEHIKEIFSGAKPLFEAIGQALGTIFEGLHKNIMSFLQNTTASDILGMANGGIFALLGAGLLNITNGIQSAFEEFSGLGEIIKGSSSTISEAIGNILKSVNPIKEDDDLGDVLIKFAIAIGILAGSLIFLATVPTQELFAAVGAIAALAGVLYLLMKGLSNLDTSTSSSEGKGGIFGKLFGGNGSSKETNILKMSGAILMIAVGIGILAGAVKKLGELNIVQVITGVAAIGAMMFMMVKVAESLSKMEGKAIKGAGALVTFASAINIMSKAVVTLGTMEPEAMVRGLLGLAGVLGEVLLFVNLLDKKGMKLGTGVAIIALAAGLMILTKSISAMSEMDPNKLALGLFGVAVALGEIVLFSKVVNPKGILKTGVAMIAMAAGLAIIANVIEKFSKLDPSNLALGLFALGVALGEFAIFSKTTGGWNFLGLSVGMIAMATGITILSAALKVLSTIPITALIASLAAIAGIFVIMGTAAAILGPLLPVILGLSAAMALLGVGVLSLSMGLTGLSVALVAFAGSVVANIQLIIDAFVVLVGGILGAIGTLIPQLIEVGMAIILALLQGIANNIEAITVAAVGIITNFILGIAESLTMIIEAGIVLILALINGIAQGLKEHGPELVAAIIELIKSILSLLWEMVTQSLGFIADAFNWIVEKLGWVGEKLGIISKEAAEEYDKSLDLKDPTEQELNDTVSTISSKSGDVNSATNQLGQSGYDGLNSWLDKYSNLGDQSGENYIMSIINTNTGSIQGLPEEAIEIMRQHGWEFEDVGADAGQGYVNGIYSKVYAAEKAAEDLTGAALRRIRSTQLSSSPSKITTRLGTYFGDGYVIGISKREKAAEKAAENLSSGAIDTMRGALSRVSDILGSDLDNAPTIRPVLDLSDVESGMDTVNGMFGARSLALTGVNDATFTANRDIMLNGRVTNDSIINEIAKLRGDITTLGDNVGKMQIVMDSGALVGQITRPMDNALGRRAMYKGRGL